MVQWRGRLSAAALIVWLLAPPTGRAEGLHGVVSDAGGRPIAGVVVQVTELGRSATTQADGRFAFAGVPRGIYSLLCRAPGYAPLVRRVDTADTVEVEIVLEPAIIHLDAVTVTATREPINPLTAPLPTGSLGAAALAREYRVSLAHALESQAGVRALTTGGEIGKPVIRGLTGARVLVLGDGNRLEDYSWSDEDGPSVETRLADRVEVIRGPASVLYGSDALGGVINVLPQDVPDARAGAPFRARVEMYGASNNRELGSALHAEGANGPLGWLAGVVGRRSEALHTPDGELDNTGFLALSGEGAVGTQGDWGKATLRFTHYGGEFHLLEADTAQLPPPPPAGGKEQGPVRKLSDDRLQAGGNFPVGGMRLEAKAQWQRHWLAEVVEGDTVSAEQGFDLLLNTMSLDLVAHHASGRHVLGAIGASGFYQNSDTRGAEPLVPNAHGAGAAAFAFEQAAFGRWSLLGGLRVDLRRLDADANVTLGTSVTRRDYTAWSGDAGLVFRPAPTLALAANVGRAWRAPTLFELLTDGPHPGEARFEVGQPDLVPEAGLNLDVSLRWRGARAHAELAGFRNRIAHYIYIVPTGTIQDSLPVYRYQQADAVLWGGEASLEVQAGSAVALSARLDYVRGERQADGQPLPQIPPLRVKLGGEWHRGGTIVGLDLDLFARQTRLGPFDIGTAGYGLVDLFAGIAPRLGTRTLRVELQLHNALDTRYRDFLSRYKAFALNPGRNIVMRLATDF